MICPVNSDSVQLAATNGLSYAVCLSYIFTPITGLKIYIYPDTIVLSDGSGILKKRSSSSYEFIPKGQTTLLTGNDVVYITAVNNGKVYGIRLSYVQDPITQVRSYVYPETILLTDGSGSLKKISSTNTYNFVAKVNVINPNDNGQDGDKPNNEKPENIIAGIDNTTLLLVGAGLLLFLSFK